VKNVVIHYTVLIGERKMKTPQVINMKSRAILNAVRIDRATSYGNPFILGRDGNREEVCELFSHYAAFRLKIQPHWLDVLQGKDLACWCAPLQCHGDILLRLANK